MYWWSFVGADNEAGDLQITSNPVVVVIWVEHSYPYFVELVIQRPLQSRQSNTILPNQFVLEDSIVIIHLEDQLKCFQLVLIHFKLVECK